MAKWGFWRTAMKETQHLINTARAEVRQEKKWVVDFPGHGKVKAAIERYPTMVYENQTDGCLPCQNRTAKNPWTCCRFNLTGAPPQVWRKQPTPEQTPPPPEAPPSPPGDDHGAESFQIANLPVRYVYKPTLLPRAQFFNCDASIKDSEYDEDLIPDPRTDKGTSTG